MEQQQHTGPVPPGLEWIVDTFEASGCACAIGFGLSQPAHLTGYLRLPDGFPSHMAPMVESQKERGRDISYREGGWIGFHTGHGWDYWAPSEIGPYVPDEVRTVYDMARSIPALNREPGPDSITWTFERVRSVLERMAVMARVVTDREAKLS